MQQKILNILKFLKDVELLKSVIRHSWTSSGRQESVAEHSWRLAVMAIVLEEEFRQVDIKKVIEMVIVHDFGEVYEGDFPTFQKQPSNKAKIEERAVRKLVEPLAPNVQNKIIKLSNEFHEYKTLEAKLARALDGLEVLIQHNEADLSTWVSKEYTYNLTCSRKYMGFHKFIKKFREIIDKQTREKVAEEKK